MVKCFDQQFNIDLYPNFSSLSTFLDIKEDVSQGYKFLLVPTESTSPSPSDEFDDLLNDSISHTFLDSLIYVMFPVSLN